MDDATPVDPMTLLAESAAQTHELFSAYVAAGFRREEAMQIITTILSTQLRPPPQ